MDTFASLVLSGELPAPKNQLLLQTTPFKKSQDNLLTFDMKFNIAVQTAYQQLILFCMFYNGSVFFENKDPNNIFEIGKNKSWQETAFFKGTLPNGEVDFYSEPTKKCKDYTFIYNVFFFMQVWNFFICRKTYEKSGVLERTAQLFIDLFMREKIQPTAKSRSKSKI